MTAIHLAIASPYILPCLVPAVAGPFGGAERQLAGIARGLAERGHRVDIICLAPAGEAPSEWAGGLILTTFKESQGVRGVRFFYPRLVSFLRALDRSGARTVLMRSASGEAGIASLEGSLRRRRTVLSIASETDLALRARPGMNVRDRLLYRHALRRANLVVVQSASQKAAFERSFGTSRVRHIPSWAEIPPSPGSRPRDHFLFAGALRREKRADLFLDAAEVMPERKFLLLGGPASSLDRELFERAEHRARSIPNVELRGLVSPPEVSEALDRAIALVNTSEYEGFPNTFLEAWSHGVPVVTVHADPDELICSRRLGIHTRSDEALVTALRRVADHPDQAAAMGSRGREYCLRTHGYEGVVSRWEESLLAMGA